MATYFLDTSALVKLYVAEAGSPEMIKLATAPDEPRLVILSLSRAELHSAVRRRERSGELLAEDAETALSSFNGHLGSVFMMQAVTESVLERALTLVDTHELRAYDSVQLAGCLAQVAYSADEIPVFVCSDSKLLEVARAEGLSVLNPSG